MVLFIFIVLSFLVLILWSYATNYFSKSISGYIIKKKLQKKGLELVDMKNIDKPKFIKEIDDDNSFKSLIIIKGLGTPYHNYYREITYTDDSLKKKNCIAIIYKFIFIPIDIKLLFTNQPVIEKTE